MFSCLFLPRSLLARQKKATKTTTTTTTTTMIITVRCPVLKPPFDVEELGPSPLSMTDDADVRGDEAGDDGSGIDELIGLDPIVTVGVV